MEIPIKNIYYLLCYAWDKLEERDLVDVDKITSNNLVDMFAIVLINATTRLIKKGFDRHYIEQVNEVCGVKGKLNLAATIKGNKLANLKTICEYDELSYSILHNQILKTTISKLRRTAGIDKQLRDRLHFVENNLPPIDEIHIKLKHFKQVQLHRNNCHYDFVLKVCQLIFECQLIDESKGNYRFKDFTRDRKKMAELFEAFVKNYYKIRHTEFNSVKSDIIEWKLQTINGSDKGVIPKMRTDITLTSDSKKIIIDTKYYPKALVSSRIDSKEKFISHHLYQLLAYIINQEDNEIKISMTCEGILLYPTVDVEFDYKYSHKDHIIRLMTINLDQDWIGIEKSMDEIVKT